MKILLINTNSVVSRLLALCTRGSDLELDEVQSVDEIGDAAYDLLFLDDSAYGDNIVSWLPEKKIGKKIFISYSENEIKGFDETIQKPFLPSQISQVIESVDIDDSLEKHIISPLPSEEKPIKEEDTLSIFRSLLEEEKAVEILESQDEPEKEEVTVEEVPAKVLDADEIDKIKGLLDMDDESNAVDLLSEEEVALRKVEVIKEQLISEGVEILEEDEIIEELSTKTKEKKVFKSKKNKLKYKKEQKKKQALLHCSKEEFFQIESAVTKALARLKPEKIKKFLKGKELKLKIKLEDSK